MGRQLIEPSKPQPKENSPDNKLTDEKPEPTKQPERVTPKAAKMFNTNRTYISAVLHGKR